ncbi:hypothetical protein BGZ99_004221 [Dissophora globulifera]|uniref:DDE Tnp4 domain-containing protein n=1 Tax=Dissophora globulifera TaxID=979702 RepID=A0A9P6RJA9_9FUNG|nr:hypothetical protein BGZ99_004221 [Dissophora globulifera]
MVSERKKILALLDRRQRLEDEYQTSTSDMRKHSIMIELDTINTNLLRHFRCTSLEELQELYPTTQAMKSAAENQRYIVSRKLTQLRTGDVYNALRLTGTDAEYLELVRVSKSVFCSLGASVMSQHSAFKNPAHQESFLKQLAVTLWRLGHHGSEAGISEASRIFGLSEGSIIKCTQRCMEALKDISGDVISWPTQGERQTVKNRIKSITGAASSSSRDDGDHGTPSEAIGILSTMNVFLVSRPLLDNTDDYLIPLHPSALASAASLSQSMGSVAGVDSLKPATTKKAQKSSEKNIRRSQDRESCENTVKDDAAVRQEHENAAESRTQEQQQQPSTGEMDMSLTTSSPSPQKVSKPRKYPPNFVKTVYLKRDYGYNVMIVCDSNTRIRFTNVTRPAAWNGQRVFESTGLFLEPAKFFGSKEYVIASSAFEPNVNVVSVAEQHPSSIHLKARMHSGDGTTDSATASDEDQEGNIEKDTEVTRCLNQALNAAQKRAVDCQRTLKARFPSLLGMRVQLKDDAASQEHANNWIIACMTIHNLVLGDYTSYNPEWEKQLDKIEKQIMQQQEQQARLIWKLENQPSKKSRLVTRDEDAAASLAEDGDAARTITSAKGKAPTAKGVVEGDIDNEGNFDNTDDDVDEELHYELMDRPTPGSTQPSTGSSLGQT